MRLIQIDLTMVRLPLVRPFQTSSSRKEHLDHILVRVRTADGVDRLGRVRQPVRPLLLSRRRRRPAGTSSRDFLAPMVLGRDWSTIDELTAFYRLVKGNAFARAGLEMACWDALGEKPGETAVGTARWHARRDPLRRQPRHRARRPNALLDRIDQFLDEGYRRIKLKIGPGKDVEVVRTSPPAIS